MGKVGVITDTVACLPRDVVEKYDISIIPIPMSINGKTYLDQVDITPEEFWKIFDDMKEFTTGAPSQGIYLETFKKASRKYSKIACVFVSSQLSAVYESAVQASKTFTRENPSVNINIIDSRTASGAEGFVALEMARASDDGKNLEEVVQAGNSMIFRSKWVGSMDTLKYIIKSGRAPKTAYVGEIFQVKPIIGAVNNTGLVENLGRIRGKQAALKKIPEMLKQYTDCSKPLHIFVHYTNNIENGNYLKDRVTSLYNCAEVYMTPYTPVMSGHTGPMFAVAFYS